MYLMNLMMKYDWHCYDPEDWWAHGGRSFWCVGPYPMDRYQWTGTHGDMISSDLHGAEEPIRWLLGWQRQDNVMMSLCTRRQKDVQPGHFGRARPRGNHPLQMECLPMMDRTSPGRAGRCLERVAVCWGHLARVAAWRSPKGANVWFSGCCACPKRANVSLRRAWRPSFSSFYDIFLAINVKTV